MNLVAEYIFEILDYWLKGLIEKLFKGTGNKVMAKIWDEDIEQQWQQFQKENNL